MSLTLTIAKRELTSFFYSPIAYLVLVLAALGTAGLFVFLNFQAGAPANLRTTMSFLVWILILLAPAISMGLLSAELRSGTIETLLTSPVTDAEVILGKWLGAVGFLSVLFTPLIVMTMILAAFSKPDLGPILSGMLGLLLVGSLYLAIGTFMSAMTQNQLIAFILTVFIVLSFTAGLYLLGSQRFITPGLQSVIFFLNVNTQFEDFSKGIVDLGNIAYFVAGIGIFLFLAAKAMESRKWR